jgi:hypothetical protein
MALGTVASRPNAGLGEDATRSNIEVTIVASRPNLGLGGDLSRPTCIWARTCLGPTWSWTRLRRTWSWMRSHPDPTWG